MVCFRPLCVDQSPLPLSSPLSLPAILGRRRLIKAGCDWKFSAPPGRHFRSGALAALARAANAANAPSLRLTAALMRLAQWRRPANWEASAKSESALVKYKDMGKLYVLLMIGLRHILSWCYQRSGNTFRA